MRPALSTFETRRQNAEDSGKRRESVDEEARRAPRADGRRSETGDAVSDDCAVRTRESSLRIWAWVLCRLKKSGRRLTSLTRTAAALLTPKS